MKKFNEPEVTLYPLVIKDRLTNGTMDGQDPDTSNILDEDELDTQG